MTTDFKKKLLLGAAGMAIVAGGAMMAPGYASADIFIDSNDDGTYNEETNAGEDFTGKTTGKDAQVQTSVSVDVGADFTVGQLGDDSGSGAASRASLTQSVNGKTITFEHDDGTANEDNKLTFNGDADEAAITITGAQTELNVTFKGDGGKNNKFQVDINGDVNLGSAGDLVIQGLGADKEVYVTVNGDITAQKITLQAAGTNDDSSRLTLDGSSAQVVTGTIDGGADDEGELIIANTSATDTVTFVNDIGGSKTISTLTIGAVTNNTSTLFQGDVNTANGITVGNAAGTETHTVTFGAATATADTTVQGTIDAGGDETDVVNVVVQGGKTVTFSGGKIGNTQAIDNITINGTGTTAKFSKEFEISENVTVGAGASIDLNHAGQYKGNDATSHIQLNANSTITASANALWNFDIKGATNGGGTLVVNGGTVTAQDDIGLTNSLALIDIKAGKNLVVDGDTAGAAIVVNANEIRLAGNNSKLTINPDNTKSVTVTGNITATTNGKGELQITDGGTDTVAFVGNIGAAGQLLESVNTGNGGNVATVTLTGNLYATTTTIEDEDILRFNGTTTQTVGGKIVGGAGGA